MINIWIIGRIVETPQNMDPMIIDLTVGTPKTINPMIKKNYVDCRSHGGNTNPMMKYMRINDPMVKTS